MADQSQQSIVIAAAPAAIMAIIADFERYPEWAGSVKRCDVTAAGADGRAERVAFTVDAGVFKDEYELAYTWTGDERVEWDLVQGKMQKEQHGSYDLQAQGDGTKVTYSLRVELNMPMLGMLKRKGEKMIMDIALKDLKKRAESGA